MGYRPRHLAGTAQREKIRRSMVILLALAVTVLVAWLFIEPHMLTIDTKTVESSDLPKDIGQLRIVYLTDIHYGSFFGRGQLNELVSRVNTLNADLILLGGDYAEDTAAATDFFRNFPSFNSRYGIYAVFGEHDRTDMSNEAVFRLRNAMMTAGVSPLINSAETVRIGNSSITVCGTDDLTTGLGDVSDTAALVKSSDFVVFLSHSPEAISEALRSDSSDGQRKWFDLGLFGHTHGGQLLGVGQYLGIGGLSSRYLRGWRTENTIDMLISNGLGTSVVPMRFLVPPQIHVITVTAGS